MRQQLLRRVGELCGNGNREAGVGRREPGSSHYRVLNIVSLPPQSAYLSKAAPNWPRTATSTA